MLDNAFEALKTYDWGTNPGELEPINQAVITTRGNGAARGDLEKRLADVLKTGVSRDAKDYVCRKLMIVGTKASVPNLAELLPDKDHSHMARYALERIPADEAATALRDALPKVSNELKVGMISSLGARRDKGSVSVLSGLLSDSDAKVASAAACALGDIGTAEAAKALAEAKADTSDAKADLADARLVCAESLLKANNNAEALALYKSLVGGEQAKHVRLAATRGMLACAGKKD